MILLSKETAISDLIDRASVLIVGYFCHFKKVNIYFKFLSDFQMDIIDQENDY